MKFKLTIPRLSMRKQGLAFIMRTFVFLFCTTVFSFSSGDLLSQNSKIVFDEDKMMTVNHIFDMIDQQTDYSFVYKSEMFIDFPAIKVKKGIIRTNKLLKEILTTDDFNVIVTENDVIIIEEKIVETIVVQEIEISGIVTDEDGEPLPGASIVEKGTANGTQTDFDGNFSLEVANDNATLVIAFLGFKTMEIPVNGQTTLNIVLEESFASLDEVLVIGYGSQKQREITGSIAAMDMDQLSDQNVGQAIQKLQGQLAGVQINQSNGVPGQETAIRIRGAASINAGNQPLYVIDGFPVEGGLRMVNPNEIENISVLKGSSASSLYGSRAANGVVLVTTKRAKEGETIVKLNVNFGVSQVPQKGRPEYMNAKEFLTYHKRNWEDRIQYHGFTGEIPEIYQNPEAWTGPDTDWFDVLTQDSFRKSYNLSLLTNNGKFSSANMVGYYTEEGGIINSDYERFSLRSNNEYEVNDNIRMGFNVAPTYQITNNLNLIGLEDDWQGQYNMLYAASATPPIFGPNDKNPDGSPALSFSAPGTFSFPNWVNSANQQTNVSKEIRLLSSVYGEVDFLENFTFRSSASIDYKSGPNRTFYPSTMSAFIFSPLPPAPATGSYGTSNSTSWLLENNLRFTKTYANNHNIGALVGYSTQAYRMENLGFSGNQFPDDLVPWLDAASNVTSWNNGMSEWSMMSMYGRLNYNYKSKYLLSVSVRRDGSSRFGSKSQWGSFPSVSAGWIISDENFAEGLSVVNYLKLRAEYGVVGNFNIGNYSQFGNISTANYVFNNSIAAGRSQGTLGNNNLTWETTSGMDIGVDITAFNNRVAFTYDYYDKTTDDMLYQIDIPWGTGFSNVQDNIGEFHFWGHEVALNTKNLVGDLKWNTNFNISFNRNKVISLGTNDEPIGGVSWWIGDSNRTAVGHPIGGFWGWESDGVYMTQEEFDTQPKHTSSAVGSNRYKDLNDDGIIDEEDRTFLGNPNPDFNYGITNSFSYKNFDLNIVIIGAQGGDKARTIKEWTEYHGVFNAERYLKDIWRSPENPGAGVLGSFTQSDFAISTTNTRWIEDASYLSVSNISLGYTLPSIKHVSNARVFVSAQNALLFTNYSGANPQASRAELNGLRQGIDDNAYPLSRTFTLGLDFTF